MRLKDTLSGEVKEFQPIAKGSVSMYNCGPTVYNFAHIGNLRTYVFADTIRRAFEFLGYKVNQVINITDVGHLHETENGEDGQDKVEVMANREQKTAKEITEFYTKAFLSDLEKLNIETENTKFPKATEHIKEQIDLIQKLEKLGLTYRGTDGVYFDTSRFVGYGKLGNIDVDNLLEGARVSTNFHKRNPSDFALWKFSSSGEKRQQEWPSPWGVGFPGWHIECSAMSMKYLGETFDIHTGGIDHIPVHHNNEIAQSESVTKKPLANFWMHGAFVNVENGKMAKSKDNFIKLSDLESRGLHPLAYRFWLLTARYSTPISFSFESIHSAQNALESIAIRISRSKNKQIFNPIKIIQNREIKKKIHQAVNDDLDTPKLIALLHECADKIASGKLDRRIISAFDKLLGLKLEKLVRQLNDVPETIKKLSAERERFRQDKNWSEADRIRLELEKQGFYIEDSDSGPIVRKKLSSLIGII